ncbi:MAG: excinuclease ABC subunit UvrC [Dissulfuribacterales bacterium]
MHTINLSLSAPEILKLVPKSPGVYLFRNEEQRVIYVGKAKELRARISNYLFNPSSSPKTFHMLQHAAGLEYIVTATEKEALLLEFNLIKEHRPKYNIVMRDDKAYPFLRIDTSQPFGRISVVRRRQKDDAIYYGPYPSSTAVREVMSLVGSIFQLRTCSDSQMKNRERPCLKFQVKRCSAPCIDAISQEEYRERIQQLKLFLEGRQKHLLKELQARMEQYAETMEFERAAVLRNRIAAIKAITEHQAMVADLNANWDVIGMARDERRAAVSILHVRDGVVRGHESKIYLVSDEPDEEILSLFIRDYFATNPISEQILISKEPADMELLSDWLRDMERHCRIVTGTFRSIRKRLVDMAQTNAAEAIFREVRQEREWTELARNLQNTLKLEKPPYRIETIDISTTGGELPVGSLVAFENGQPRKSGYRHYNIRTVEGIDDYAMIREVVLRRLASGMEKNDLPDLMVIDGGKGQLFEAISAWKELNMPEGIAFASIAKERHGEGEKLYAMDGTQVMLVSNDPILLFMQRMRDEAHRFGVTFHRKKRSSARFQGQLLQLPGIGPKRQKAMLQHFGSLKRLKQATLEELKQVPGISNGLAKKIYEELHKKALPMAMEYF